MIFPFSWVILGSMLIFKGGLVLMVLTFMEASECFEANFGRKQQSLGNVT